MPVGCDARPEVHSLLPAEAVEFEVRDRTLREADATARVGNRIKSVETRVQAGSNHGPVRHTFASRVQMGSKQKACKSCVFNERWL